MQRQKQFENTSAASTELFAANIGSHYPACRERIEQANITPDDLIMSANGGNAEAEARADDSQRQDILDSIYNLIDKKLELAIVAYAKSLGTDVEYSSLAANIRFESECDRLKIRVHGLLNTHEGNLKKICREELGLTDQASPNDLETGSEDPENDREDLGPDPGNFEVATGELEAVPRDPKRPARPDGPSPMARKFLAAGDSDVWHVDKDLMEMQEAAEREKKKPYFFYGSLMDASTLQRVLGLGERPQLEPASIVGYHVKMWGPYPALQNGPQGNVVRGMMWEVEGAKRKDRLAEYETNNYKEKGCIIKKEDGSSVWGTTFIWDGDTSELKEGTFDLKDWQMNQLDRS
ncbi:hypothetical protein SLS62_001856 [Diatrype stigma]|uniref:Putative gamma-glutamylcyclotransferase n=1 Tax=Diatrype stigma TaxID=117547 RepID=A0AAN9YWB8_9PEZI